MNWEPCLFLIVTCFVIVHGIGDSGSKHGKVVVCFVPSLALYRNSPLDFRISDIDPKLCTHIVYAHAVLDEQSNTIKSSDTWIDIEANDGRAGYRSLTEIKKNHPRVKITLRVGGWSEGSVIYSKMAADKLKRASFISSVIQYLVKYEFDGIDMMWNHPTRGGGIPEDKKNFVTLIKELKEAFLPYDFILTATLANDREIMSTAYDLVNLDRYLDYIYLSGYDYYGPWSRIVGHLAPLKGSNKPDVKNVEYTIKYMLTFGVCPEKLVLGIPFFGRTFLLTEHDVKDIEFGRTVATEYGYNGPFLNGTNSFGYNEICLNIINDSNWSYHWDKTSSTPYLRDGRRVISYENTRSIANKIKLAINYNLRGFMVWSINKDDYKGYCDMPNDTYADFLERYDNLAKDNSLEEALKAVELYQGENGGELKCNGYKNLRDKIGRTEEKFTNYPLLRTIHRAIEIALEEQMIAEEMEHEQK